MVTKVPEEGCRVVRVKLPIGDPEGPMPPWLGPGVGLTVKPLKGQAPANASWGMGKGPAVGGSSTGITVLMPMNTLDRKTGTAPWGNLITPPI